MNLRLLLLAIAGIGLFALSVELYRTFNPYDPTLKANQGSDVNALPALPGSFDLYANQPRWQPIGRGPLSITAAGTINFGGQTATPGASKTIGGQTALAPGVPLGILVAKIGETGEPFKCGIGCKISAKDTVYVAINDFDHDDNTGFYVVTIKRYDELP